MSRINVGVEGLNELLGGGIEENRAYLITGRSGVGKTIFCLQFIYSGLKAGDSAVFVTVHEKPKDIIDDAKSFGWDLEKYLKSKKLYILDMSPYITINPEKGEELDIRRMVTDLSDYIRKTSAKRVVIESMDYIAAHSSESERNAEEYLREIILSSTNLGYTSLITSVLPSTPTELSIYSTEERLVDGVITLDIDEKENKRFLFVRKMRKTGVKLSKYEYDISEKVGLELKSSKSSSASIKVGEKAPEFAIDAYYNGELVKLSSTDYHGKWLVVVFYPGDFTFVCPTELSGIADRYQSFTSQGAEVLSVSMNSFASHKKWAESSPVIARIPYPMGADPTGNVCGLFGVLTSEGTTERAAFIINPDWKVVSVEVTDDKIGRSTDELLRKLDAAKYLRAHPDEMCPEGWTRGKPTLKP